MHIRNKSLARPDNIMRHRIFVHEGCQTTIVRKYGVAEEARMTADALPFTPGVAIGTVIIQSSAEIRQATSDMAKVACMDVPSLNRAISDGYTFLWSYTNTRAHTRLCGRCGWHGGGGDGGGFETP